MKTIVELKKLHIETSKLLDRKLRRAGQLRKMIAAAQNRLSALEAELATLEGTGPAAARSKRRGASSKAKQGRPAVKQRKKAARKVPPQRELAVQVLKAAGKPLSLDDIMKGMAARGCKWTSKEPRKAMGVLLYADKKTFRKVAKGMFVPKA